jgi:hypothetical protein
LLLPYAHAVLDAQELWRRADALIAQAGAADRASAAAAAAQGVARLAGPLPGEGLRLAAERLRAEAIDVEHRAAVVCATRLDEEAQRAPATSGWQSADRFIGDVAMVGVDTVAGAASIVRSAWRSLPGIGSRHSRHEARHELGAAAVAAAEIWNIPIDLYRDMQDGRTGLAAGELLSMATPGRVGRYDRRYIRNLSLAQEQAFREADLVARLATHDPWGQTPTDMVRRGVLLLNEEKRGGHTLAEHAGQSRAYLLSRLSRVKTASSFFDEASAERLVNEVLARRSEEIWDVYLEPEGQFHAMDFDFGSAVTGRFAMRGSSRTFPAHGVRVVIGLDGGLPYVHTAYPTP